MTRFPTDTATSTSRRAKNLRSGEKCAVTLPPGEALAAATVVAVDVLPPEVNSMAITTQPTTPTPQGDRPPRRSRRGLLLAVLSSLVVAALIVAAIVVMQSRSDKSGTVVAGGSTGTTVATPRTEEQKVVAAYRGYWEAVYAANNPPDPNSPRLAAYATGPQLESAQNAVASNIRQGVAVRVPAQSVATYNAQVTSISGDKAEVRSCDVDDSFLVRLSDGQVVDPSGRPAKAGVGTDSIKAQLTREGAAWKISSLQFEQHWEGVAGCASAR